MVMTIITGVNSPWILGKPAYLEKKAEAVKQMEEGLGIEVID
jgi:hypothetical protein